MDTHDRPALTPTQRRARDAMLNYGKQEAIENGDPRWSRPRNQTTRQFSRRTLDVLVTKGYARRIEAAYPDPARYVAVSG